MEHPLLVLLQLGVSTLEGGKGAIRRRLITTAFHLDKLKVLPLLHMRAPNLQLYFSIETSTALFRHTSKKTSMGRMSIPAGADLLLPTLFD
ncbi:hypothetical protein QQP08_024572 [Theobroma cacao]|nr:hypothetical protein QQP08_024572 [Theobroma cacao]